MDDDVAIGNQVQSSAIKMTTWRSAHMLGTVNLVCRPDAHAARRDVEKVVSARRGRRTPAPESIGARHGVVSYGVGDGEALWKGCGRAVGGAVDGAVGGAVEGAVGCGGDAAWGWSKRRTRRQ